MDSSAASPSNASRGNAHESWLESLLSNPSEPIAQALFPEILFRAEHLANRHPDGAASKTDLLTKTDLLNIRISAKEAKGSGSLNQIERSWPARLLGSGCSSVAMRGIELMCGSLDGSSILGEEDRISPDTLPEQVLSETIRMLDERRLRLCSKALGTKQSVTHILFSFIGVNKEDIHVALPAASFIRWLAANDKDGRWARVSPKGGAFSLGKGLILKRKGGDNGAKGANQAQLSLRSAIVLSSALQGEISGSRIWREPSSAVMAAISSGSDDWETLWDLEREHRCAPLSEKSRTPLIDLHLKRLSDFRGAALDKSEKSLLRKIRFAPDFILRPWVSGAISSHNSAKMIRDLLSSNPSPSHAQWVDLLLVCVTHSVSRLHGAASQNQIAERKEAFVARKSETPQMKAFLASVANGYSSRKHLLSISSVWRGFSESHPSALEAAQLLIGSGLGAQRLLGFRNLDPEAKDAAVERLLQCAEGIRQGKKLSAALAEVGGGIIPSVQRRESSRLKEAKGRPAIIDEPLRLATEISAKRGWALSGKNFHMLRSFFSAAGEADRLLLCAAAEKSINLQKILPSWDNATPRQRNDARIALGSFCEDAALLAGALDSGEAFMAGKKDFRRRWILFAPPFDWRGAGAPTPYFAFKPSCGSSPSRSDPALFQL